MTGSVSRVARRSTRHWWMSILAAAIVVALSVVAVVLARQNASLQDELAAQRVSASELTATKDAVSAARTAAEAATSYNYTTIDRDFGWLERYGTRSFVDQHRDDTRALRDLVVATRSHAVGHVIAAAGSAEDGDHVDVLLFVDQRLTKDHGKPTTDRTRVELSMVREEDQWLIDDLQLH